MRYELQALEPRTLLANTPIVIDVMVLYTPGAQAEAGGQQVIVDRIRRAVADANMVLSNSQIDVTLRLVHHQQVSYDDSSREGSRASAYAAHTWVSSEQSVAALRDEYGADLVSLWTAKISPLGVGRQPDNPDGSASDGLGYNVVDVGFANNLTFTHEIGHNLGAGHDKD